MKINPLEHTPSTDAQSKAGSKKTGQGESFSQVLNETINQNTGSVDRTVASNIAPSMPVSIDEHYQGVESMQRSFDHLDQYRTMLGDPKVSLRSMETTVNKLKKDANQLGQLLDNTKSDEQIKSLMSDTFELITREISRFEQGDYVDG